ncbi:MAG: asparaginase [Phycisphaerales bacterium]|nr:asparaginase [Phycisphaerales bacterium]
MRHLTLLTTGGTIEKTYDEATGQLLNLESAGTKNSVVARMLRRLRLEDTAVTISQLMSKDSLVMTGADRDHIARAVRAAGGCVTHPTDTTGIVILHGTDTLTVTGEHLLAMSTGADPLRVPVVLTGAMRPFEMKRSDALQNLTEAIFAAGVLPPGVYCAAHGRTLRFPGVRKDRARRTFVADQCGG